MAGGGGNPESFWKRKDKEDNNRDESNETHGGPDDDGGDEDGPSDSGIDLPATYFVSTAIQAEIADGIFQLFNITGTISSTAKVC